MSSLAVALVRTERPVPRDGDYDWYQRACMTGELPRPSKVAIENLLAPRQSRWKPLKDDPNGFWASAGHPSEFDFTHGLLLELDVAREIALVYGGEVLLIWTYGGSVVTFRGSSGEERARRGISIESVLKEHSVTGVKPPDTAALWVEFERAVRGDKVDFKRLNQVLPPRLKLEAGASPRALAEAGVQLRRSVGAPRQEPWPTRFALMDRFEEDWDDPVLCLLAGMKAEAWNAHARAEALWKRASQVAGTVEPRVPEPRPAPAELPPLTAAGEGRPIRELAEIPDPVEEHVRAQVTYPDALPALLAEDLAQVPYPVAPLVHAHGPEVRVARANWRHVRRVLGDPPSGTRVLVGNTLWILALEHGSL